MFEAPLKREGITVFVTDFGELRVGQTFEALLSSVDRSHLWARKSSKKYKAARQRMEQIEAAVSLWHEGQWILGKNPTRTP